ncbi:MAG: sugar ABC transporter permease [Symbiobacterium sp.]|jgi:Binding-protein-dependent transport system inner membrane component.|uniref:carbohydrate ABC transporter permease n=1 Tax=Symbiobacterium sp. TaxID=1971213 RepID=UPI0034645DAE
MYTARKGPGRYSYWLMLAPALVPYLLFKVYPFFQSIWLSLYEWNGIPGSPRVWVGLENYARFLYQPPFSTMFWRALRHNFIVFGLLLVWSTGLGTLLAWMLTQIRRGAGFYKSIIFMPNTVSLAVTGFLWSLMLNPQFGAVNALLRRVGLGALAMPWLGDSRLALPTVIAVNVWHGLGFPVLIALSAMLSVPRDILEAAEVDGAGRVAQFWKITFPIILPTLINLMALNFTGAFSLFEIVFVMQGAEAGPFYSTDLLGTLFYRTAFGGTGSTASGMGLGAALAVVIFLIVIPVSLLASRIRQRFQVEV